MGKKDKDTTKKKPTNFELFVAEHVDAFCALSNSMVDAVDKYHADRCTNTGPFNTVCELFNRKLFMEEFEKQLKSRKYNDLQVVTLFGMN